MNESVSRPFQASSAAHPLTRHTSPSTPTPFASSRHVALASLHRDLSLGRRYGAPVARYAGRQVHIPHKRNRPLAAPKRAVGYSCCCTTIRAGDMVCGLEQLTWQLANWGRCLDRRNPPLGLKFSQDQRTMCSYVVQWRAQAKRVFPTLRPCVASMRLARVAGHFEFRFAARLLLAYLSYSYRNLSCDVVLHLCFVNWSALSRLSAVEPCTTHLHKFFVLL